MPPSSRQEFDDGIVAHLERILEGHSDLSDEDLRRVAGDAVATSITQTAPKVTASFRRASKRLLREERRRNASVLRAIRERWGEALDGFVVLRTACREATVTYADDLRAEADHERDHVFEVLERISALSLRISSEVLHLAEHGLASAALARCRPLHELQVSAAVVAEYGRRPEYPLLAERYLMHSEIDEHTAFEAQLRSNDAPPDRRPSDNYIAERRQRHNQLLAQYGRPFKADWGWAAILFDKADDCRFANLEKLADASELRRYYAEASTHVHGGAMAAAQNIQEFEGVRYKLTDASPDGLIAPLWYASGHLLYASVLLIVNGREDEGSVWDALMLKVLDELFLEYRKVLVSLASGDKAGRGR